MREWTDLDYAQAAIDMLPGSVEEMRWFLKDQGIKGHRTNPRDRCRTCPIAQWVNKWTDVAVLVQLEEMVPEAWDRGNNWDLTLPVHVSEFIEEFDRDKFKV